MTPSSSELLECPNPWCASRQILVVQYEDLDGKTVWQAACDACTVCAPPSETEAHAREIWQMRLHTLRAPKPTPPRLREGRPERPKYYPDIRTEGWPEYIADIENYATSLERELEGKKKEGSC